MELENYRGKVITLTVREGDSLNDVPDSHLDIISPEIREAFADPPVFFKELAQKSKVKNFSAWLTKLTNRGSWRLELTETFMKERRTSGGFRWSAPGIVGATITPGKLPDLADLDQGFSDPFALVGCIRWREVGSAGGLFSAGSGYRIDKPYKDDNQEPEFPYVNCVVFGNTECGDDFIFNENGQAGFLSVEVSRAYGLGTIPEALDWIFGELLAGREPEFDYSRV